MAIHHEEQQHKNMKQQMAQPKQEQKKENQVGQLQGVQQQSEKPQEMIDGALMIEGLAPLKLQNENVEALRVQAVQEQNIAHVTEHAIEAPVDAEYAASLNTLTYHHFTKMIGTYNRGQVELSNGQLKIINNHKFSRSKGNMSVNNRALRERFLAVTIEKMGGQMPTELYEHIRKILELDQGGEQSLPLTRQQIHDVLADVNMHTSKVAKVLASDLSNDDPQFWIARAANDLLLGGLTDLPAFERSHTTPQVEKKLRETIKAIIKKAKKTEKMIFSLNEHQIDNLIKGNLELVRDDIYQAMQQLYQSMVNTDDEQPLDEGAIEHVLMHVNEIAAHVIMKRAAASEAGALLAQQGWKDYQAGLADQWEEQQQSGRKSVFTEMDHLKSCCVGGDLGLDEARAAKNAEWMELSKSERERAEIGIKDLGTLFSNLERITFYWDKALANGLTPDEAADARTAVETVTALMNKEKTDGANMELAANVLKDTRFETEFMNFKSRMESDENYLEVNLAKLLNVGESMQPQIAAEKQESYQFGMLSPKSKRIASIFFMKNSPSEYLTENDQSLANEYREMYRKVKALIGADEAQTSMTVDGVNFSIEQKKNGLLELVIDGNRLTLPVNAGFFASKMETEIIHNESLYGSEAVKQVISDFQGITYAKSDWTHVRTLCLHFLKEKTQLPSDYFNNIPTNFVREFAGYLLRGDMNKQDIIDMVDDFWKTEDQDQENKGEETVRLINGEETIELLALAEQRAQEEKQRLQELQELQEQEEYADLLQTIIRHEHPNIVEADDGWTHEERQIKNLVSDLVFASDTWTTDKVMDEPGGYMASVLDRHANDILLLIRNPKLLTDMMDKLMLDEEIKNQLRENLEIVIDNEAFQEITDLIPDEMALEIIHRLIRSELFRKDLEKMESDMVDEIQKQVNDLQKTIADSADAVFRRPQQAESTQQPNQTVQQPNQALEQALARNEKLKRQYDYNKSVDRLNEMMKESISGERGQGKFMKLVLQQYFSNVSALDQRAMVASAIRNAKPMPQIPADANREEREKIERRAQGNYLGGFLKGAGPLMQKMLQGLPIDGLPDELKDALKDMKSNLAPIPAEIVDAQLRAMVERSHGQVNKIEIMRALGAASVGQAFLCKLYGPNLPQDGKDVVIKLLRPDVRNRMEREKKIMLDCADQTDSNHGMYDTYMGQLSRIQEELDLTLEAKNVEDGKVYDESYKTVKSMKLNALIEPTNNSMVLERAPGTTVDKFLEEVNETKTMLESFYVRNAAGEPEMTTYTGWRGKRFPNLKLNRQNMGSYIKLRQRMMQQMEQLKKRQKYLVQLSRTWVTEGIYGKGFYHGDLHAGNIMINDEGLTVIDFGNATKLTSDQQTEVTRMVAAVAFGEVNQFIEGLHNLLEYKDEKERKEKEAYFQEKRKDLKKEFEAIFKLGNHQQAGQRIAVALLKAQELGIQVPPAIFNFSQCQIRLQNALEEMNGLIKTLQDGLVSAMNLDCHYAGIATNQLQDMQSAAPSEANAVENAKKEYGFPSETDVIAALDEQIEKNKTVEEVYLEYVNTYYLEVDDSMEKFKSIFARKKNGEFKEEDVYEGTYALHPFSGIPALASGMSAVKQKFLDALRSPEYDEEKVKVFLDVISPFAESGKEARQRFKQALGAYYTASKERMGEEQMAQLRHEFHQAVCELKTVNYFYMDGSAPAFMGMLEATDKTNVQHMNWLCEALSEDENFGGQQLREAYHAFRTAQQAYEADGQNPELRREYVQTEQAFVVVYHRALSKQIDEIQKVHKMGKWYEPDTFFDVMADVITQNLSTSLSRLGKITSVKYTGKVKHLNDSMQYENIDDQLRQAMAAVNNANQGGAQA